jgi:hypothetical protein
MRQVRRHLRRGVAGWLLAHALTFTALLPRDCCAAHAHAAHGDHAAQAAEAAAPACHETGADAATPAPGAHCEMAPADGAACPMHDRAPLAPDCAMTGICGAPVAMLQAVLMQPAVPVAQTTFAPLLVEELVVHGAPAAPRSLAQPPDAPPPRL